MARPGIALLPLLLATAFACSQPARATNDPQPQVAAAVESAADLVPEPQAGAPVPSPAPGPLAGRRICLDPGHDAYWAIGATGYNRSGVVPRHAVDQVPLYEHELTLSVAYRLRSLLEDEGAQVCVTRLPRQDGGGLQLQPYDYTGDGRVRPNGQAIEDTPEIVQPRIDYANAFGAEVLVSLHFNGAADRALHGTEVYYSDSGPRQADARRLGQSLLAALLGDLRAAGHPALDRGLRSDRYHRYSAAETQRLLANNAAVIRANRHDPANCPDCLRLVTLGNNPMSLQPGTYVAALAEIEFLSNVEFVESFLLRPDSLDFIAAALFSGLRHYFEVD